MTPPLSPPHPVLTITDRNPFGGRPRRERLKLAADPEWLERARQRAQEPDAVLSPEAVDDIGAGNCMIGLPFVDETPGQEWAVFALVAVAGIIGFTAAGFLLGVGFAAARLAIAWLCGLPADLS